MANKKILIIEDDTYTRDIYQEILEEAGFNITTAIDGEDGLNKLNQGGFDLALLDVMMPKKNGLEVLEALQKTSVKPTNGPIILLTNLAHDPIITDALSRGAKSYMIKSDMNPNQLVENVKKFLE